MWIMRFLRKNWKIFFTTIMTIVAIFSLTMTAGFITTKDSNIYGMGNVAESYNASNVYDVIEDVNEIVDVEETQFDTATEESEVTGPTEVTVPTEVIVENEWGRIIIQYPEYLHELKNEEIQVMVNTSSRAVENHAYFILVVLFLLSCVFWGLSIVLK